MERDAADGSHGKARRLAAGRQVPDVAGTGGEERVVPRELDRFRSPQVVPEMQPLAAGRVQDGHGAGRVGREQRPVRREDEVLEVLLPFDDLPQVLFGGGVPQAERPVFDDRDRLPVRGRADGGAAPGVERRGVRRHVMRADRVPAPHDGSTVAEKSDVAQGLGHSAEPGDLPGRRHVPEAEVGFAHAAGKQRLPVGREGERLDEIPRPTERGLELPRGDIPDADRVASGRGGEPAVGRAGDGPDETSMPERHGAEPGRRARGKRLLGSHPGGRSVLFHPHALEGARHDRAVRVGDAHAAFEDPDLEPAAREDRLEARPQDLNVGDRGLHHERLALMGDVERRRAAGQLDAPRRQKQIRLGREVDAAVIGKLEGTALAVPGSGPSLRQRHGPFDDADCGRTGRREDPREKQRGGRSQSADDRSPGGGTPGLPFVEDAQRLTAPVERLAAVGAAFEVLLDLLSLPGLGEILQVIQEGGGHVLTSHRRASPWRIGCAPELRASSISLCPREWSGVPRSPDR